MTKKKKKLFAYRSKAHEGEEVWLFVEPKPPVIEKSVNPWGAPYEDADPYPDFEMCYTGFRRATGIALRKGQMVELNVKNLGTVKYETRK